MHLVLNLDKPRGITSQDAVTKAKRLFGARKAGHAGTLDPLATGVLLVCLNEATKIAGYLSDLEKEYTATLKLGERTDTFDSEGRVIEKGVNDPSLITEADIERTLEGFRGSIKQVPPMFSAIKKDGRPLYELARKGIEVKREPRTVLIHSLDIEGFEPPFLKLRTACSKGTYIRSLADDIGRALGTGAHIVELRRTRVGGFGVGDSAVLSEAQTSPKAVKTIDEALSHLDEIVLSKEDFQRASHGGAVALKDGMPLGFVRLKDPEGRLFAVGFVENLKINIERIFHL